MGGMWQPKSETTDFMSSIVMCGKSLVMSYDEHCVTYKSKTLYIHLVSIRLLLWFGTQSCVYQLHIHFVQSAASQLTEQTRNLISPRRGLLG